MPTNSMKRAIFAAALTVLFNVTIAHELTIDQENAIRYAEKLNLTADPDISKSFK
jgi:DNA-directed RNA polymerase subunit F